MSNRLIRKNVEKIVWKSIWQNEKRDLKVWKVVINSFNLRKCRKKSLELKKYVTGNPVKVKKIGKNRI